MFSRFVQQFFVKSTIHGLSHIAEPKRTIPERIVWIFLISIAFYGTFILSEMTLTRYMENPTVISMERDRFAFNTAFPAVTICPTRKFDPVSLDNHLWKFDNRSGKVLQKPFLISLAEANYYNFDKVLTDDDRNGVVPEDYLKLMLNLQITLKTATTNSRGEDFKTSLEKVITEMGVCYSFNSRVAVYNTPDYWMENRWNLVKGEKTFYVNALDGEFYATINNLTTGLDIYIHGPYEVADIASKKIYSPNGYFLQLYLSGLTLFSSKNIRNLAIKQRKCRFYDESNLRHSPVYSYVLCRMECRANLAKQLCGCIPHFYRKLDGEKICNVSGLHCLSKFKERLILLKGECSCLPNCDEVNYIVEDMDSREWFLGSNLQWGLKEYPKMRLRRDVIFGFSDLLVYIGGMAGLFLGCSVLSFIEILYFFSIRLFWFVVKYRKN